MRKITGWDPLVLQYAAWMQHEIDYVPYGCKVVTQLDKGNQLLKNDEWTVAVRPIRTGAGK